MDFFEQSRQEQLKREAPLAARIRPRTIDEFIGQEHILGDGRLLRRAIEVDRLFSSLIFWGASGTGKTTLAMIIANTTRSHFEVINAVMAGVADIRRVVKEAKERRGMYGQRTILLVDEIHRFNRTQQDALLPHVEDGTIILIGSTTENPYFAVVGPLLSRSRVFQFMPHSEAEIAIILRRALADTELGYGERQVEADADALEHLARIAGGDMRAALNALELAVESTPPNDDDIIHITLEVAEESIQKRAVRYDRAGDEHYDTISAFIKSIRGTDPDAALYWLAKMVAAGEDPRFILRRLYILAVEDVGLADPQAITVVSSCAQAFEWVGLPEGQYHLAMATLYLATAPKSNAVGAYWRALAYIKEHGTGPVPLPLRDKSERFHGDLKEHYKQTLGEHAEYLYPHDYPEGWVAQQYLPNNVESGWFELKGHGYEEIIAQRLREMRGEKKRET